MTSSVFANDALTDQVVLVTGASRGIGAAIAVACADAGADVAIGYRQEAGGAEATVAAVRSRGRGAEAFPADLRIASDVQERLQDYHP